jgi:hypothetical protein
MQKGPRHFGLCLNAFSSEVDNGSRQENAIILKDQGCFLISIRMRSSPCPLGPLDRTCFNLRGRRSKPGGGRPGHETKQYIKQYIIQTCINFIRRFRLIEIHVYINTPSEYLRISMHSLSCEHGFSSYSPNIRFAKYSPREGGPLCARTAPPIAGAWNRGVQPIRVGITYPFRLSQVPSTSMLSHLMGGSKHAMG